jgi:ketosteroid isomerase-like protein
MLELETAPAVNRDDLEIQALLGRLSKWQRLFSPGSKPYSLTGYEDLYDNAADSLLIYDNYSVEDTRFTGFDRYRRTWEEQINANFPGFVMYRIEVDRLEISGDLAWCGFTWWGSIVKGGETVHDGQHGTHIWRKIDGEWRIVHEHLTGPIKENGAPSRRGHA